MFQILPDIEIFQKILQLEMSGTESKLIINQSLQFLVSLYSLYSGTRCYQGDVDMMIYYGGMFYFVTYNPEALQTLIVSMTISASFILTLEG